jgi:hypothetical protein
MRAVRGRYGSRDCSLNVLFLPDDLLHIIFAKLKFKDKVSAGLVCKQWEQLLQADNPAARHWVVNYNVDKVVASKAYKTRIQGYFSQQRSLSIPRYVPVRASIPVIMSEYLVLVSG